MNKQLTTSAVTELQMDYLLSDSTRAAQCILAAIDGGAGKRAVKKLIARAEANGVDVLKAVAAEISRNEKATRRLLEKRPELISTKRFRLPVFIGLLSILFCLSASATVQIRATFQSPTGQPVNFAYLTLDLENCGFNVPSTNSQTVTMVQKHLLLRPNQLPATIYGNNEITCGNSYSTLWHVTAWADSNTKLAGDLDYDLCSSALHCLGAPTPLWNLAQSQPFTGVPPPPGFISIFGNPTQSQIITQPGGTSLAIVGVLDLTNATVIGFGGGGGGGGDVFAGTNNTFTATNTFTGLVCAAQFGNPIGAIQIVGCGTNTTIQAAITALPSTGGEVLIPPGTYAMSDTVMNKSNVLIRGSGPGTLITPSGGAGHYGFIMGTSTPGAVSKVQIKDLAINCPNDATDGIWVRKGTAVGVFLDNLKMTGCAEHVLWGEAAGALIGSFDGMIHDLDIDLIGSQIGIHITGGANGPNGIKIDHCSIRNGTLNPGASVGILIEGQAFSTTITNSYIEFMPGGDIVLRSTNGTVGNTIISGNYMETYGPNGFILDIGTGVIDTVFENNYTQSNELIAPYTTPTPYDFQIANGATGVTFRNSHFQNRGTANIHNLNVSLLANIVLENINLLSSTSPIVDSYIGVTQKSYGQAGTPLQTLVGENPFLGLQGTNAGGRKGVFFLEPSTGAAQLNWGVGFGLDGVTNTFQISPSTTIGGAIYTTPSFSCTTAGCSSPLFTSPIFNATTGFRVNGAAPNGHCLVGNGTNFVDLPCPGGSSGTITGLGTTNFIPLWTSSSSIGNSALSDNAVDTISSTERLSVVSTLTSLFTVTPATCPNGGGAVDCSSISATLIPPASQTGNAIGIYGLVAPSAPPSGNAVYSGVTGSVLTASSGIISGAVGVTGSVTTTGTSGAAGLIAAGSFGVSNTRVATVQAGVYSSVAFSGGNVEPLSADYYGLSPNFSSVVSHHYGLFLEDQTASGGTNNPDPWAIFTTGTAKSKLGGALTVVGALTLSNLASPGIQCLHVSTTGIVTGTGADCGSGGSGNVITIQGGGALGSPTDFRASTGARIVNGVSVNFVNPTGNEVEASITGPATNTFLQNSSVTELGTASQITVTGGGPLALGGSATFAIANPFIFPGKATFAASTTGAESFNIPSGVAATSPVSGDVYNKTGIVHFFDSVNDNSFVTIQTALVNGHIPKAAGVNGLLVDGYAIEGTGANIPTAGTFSGSAGASVCIDGTNTLQTSGCGTVGISGMVANQIPIAATVSTITSSFGSNVTGQIPTFQNGGPPIATSPSLTDSVNSPVTSASYTLACDTATAIVDRAHMIRFTSGAATPIVPLSTATGCTGGFVASVVNESAGTLVFSRSGSDTFSIYNGTTASLAQTTFTLTNGQYATLNQGATGIWEVLVKTNSGLPSGTQGYFMANTSGANSYATTLTLGVDLSQFSATIPFTTGTTTPTVDVTTAFNALLATLPVGARIVFPPNSHYKFAPTAGAQAAVPVQKNGFVFACGGGPGPQYSASLVAAECSLHMATAGGYIFGTGHYGNSNLPTSGPQFVNLTFVDDTAKSNAGGQIYMADVNDVLGDNLTAIGGWRQPAVAPPSAPTCTASNAGGTIGAGAVAVELEAWTTSGPTLPSAATTCASSPISGTTGSVSIVIPSPVAPIIGYEALCKVAGSSTFRTCSPAPTYTVNGDGSETINLQSATPLVVTAAPAAGARQAVPIDLSHTGGISINGSINWAGLAGFSNGPRFKNLKSYFVQGAWTCGIGGASCNLSESELMACDVVTASGACGAGNATPGLVVGLTGLRLTNVHVTGSTSSPSTGIVAALSGFNNVIMGGTFQSNTGASTEIGISMINTTGTVIKGIVLANYGSCIIADSNSSNNQADFADNGSCNGGGGASPYTDNGTGNQWLRTGKTFVLSASTTGGATINIPHGVAPSAPVNGDEWTTTSGKFDRINGTSITMAAAGTAGTASTTCTNQFFTVISATAAPTCTSITLASAQFANQGTTTTVLHGNAAGNPSFGSVLAADIANNTITGTQLAASLALVTPNIGAATGTSLLVTGNVDGTAPVTITTGTTANLGTTFKSGYTFNQEATAGAAVTYTLPATAVGLQYCVRNSIVSGTGAADTGVLTVYPPASSFVILNGVRNTVGGGGTHGVASGGAAGDSACFVAIDATDWEVYVIRGTWAAN